MSDATWESVTPVDATLHGLRSRAAERRWADAPTRTWREAHRRRLLATDCVVLFVVCGAAHVLVHGDAALTSGNLSSSAILLVGWLGALAYCRSRADRVIGRGMREGQQVVRATGLVVAWVAVASLALQWNLSRPYLAASVVAGCAGLLLGRTAWHGWLVRERKKGRHLSRVLLVGGTSSTRSLAERLARSPRGGLDVTGVWVPDSPAAEDYEVDDRTVLFMSSAHSLTDAIRLSGADTVVVADTDHLAPEGMRDLSWDLDELGVDLMLAPDVLDIARPRLHIQDVGDVVLLHLAEPRYEGATRLTKTLFDRTVALLALVALAPVMLATALAVAASSRGPILFKQVRIGIDGTPIKVWKFRTMHVGADAQLAQLLAAQGTGDRPLFKVDDDPRVTRVGAFLRQTSLDELPQLVNVLTGSMSIVGPRPQVPAEVALYGERDHYRLRVRPGITGLWQVSGRSDLPWEDAIRLDIDYVENWSMLRDLQIILRTIGVVLNRAGAR